MWITVNKETSLVDVFQRLKDKNERRRHSIRRSKCLTQSNKKKIDEEIKEADKRRMLIGKKNNIEPNKAVKKLFDPDSFHSENLFGSVTKSNLVIYIKKEFRFTCHPSTKPREIFYKENCCSRLWRIFSQVQLLGWNYFSHQKPINQCTALGGL